MRDNPPLRDGVASAAGFLSLRHISGHAFDKCRKFTLSAEAAGMRPMGCALPKARFWHAPQVIHTFSFELTKEKVVILRATPPFASLGGGFSLFPRFLRAHFFMIAEIHPFREPCGQSGEKSKSVILDFSKDPFGFTKRVLC